jgi:hypothetical protein
MLSIGGYFYRHAYDKLPFLLCMKTLHVQGSVAHNQSEWLGCGLDVHGIRVLFQAGTEMFTSTDSRLSSGPTQNPGIGVLPHG